MISWCTKSCGSFEDFFHTNVMDLKTCSRQKKNLQLLKNKINKKIIYSLTASAQRMKKCNINSKSLLFSKSKSEKSLGYNSSELSKQIEKFVLFCIIVIYKKFIFNLYYFTFENEEITFFNL